MVKDKSVKKTHKSFVAPNAEDIVIYEDDIKHEGSLRKQSLVLKWWRRRWCVLTSQYLCSFKYPRDYHKPTEVLVLSECLSVRSADRETNRENSFCVITKTRTFHLIASSAEEKEIWTAAIMNALLPELACRGLRRSLRFFAIEEEEEEEEEEEDEEDESDDEEWCPSSPKKVRRISYREINWTPYASEPTELYSTEQQDVTPKRRWSSQSSTPQNFGSARRMSIGNHFSIRRWSSGVHNLEKSCRPSEQLLEVVGDQIFISPAALASLRLPTPRGSPCRSPSRRASTVETLDEEDRPKRRVSFAAGRFRAGEPVRESLDANEPRRRAPFKLLHPEDEESSQAVLSPSRGLTGPSTFEASGEDDEAHRSIKRRSSFESSDEDDKDDRSMMRRVSFMASPAQDDEEEESTASSDSSPIIARTKSEQSVSSRLGRLTRASSIIVLEEEEQLTIEAFDEAVDAWQEQFQVGEPVQARDYEEQAWVFGHVSCADPLKVQPDGKSKGHSYQFVQRLDLDQMFDESDSECSTDSEDASISIY